MLKTEKGEYEKIAERCFKTGNWVVLVVPALLVALCLNIGAVLKNYKVTFPKLFGVALKAQLVFALSYLVAVILKSAGAVGFTYSTVNNT